MPPAHTRGERRRVDHVAGHDPRAKRPPRCALLARAVAASDPSCDADDACCSDSRRSRRRLRGAAGSKSGVNRRTRSESCAQSAPPPHLLGALGTVRTISIPSVRNTWWLVGTGLGAVAFAEPHRSCPFRGSGLTEPAWFLVLVPPRRTRRAVFPHRAPQVALA